MKISTIKTALAPALATLLITSVSAGEIKPGTTGYAARILDGKEVVIANTFKTGAASTPVKIVKDNTPLPIEYAALNQDSVAKVKFDTIAFIAAKPGDVLTMDYFGTPRNMTVSDNITHDNGDHTLIASDGVAQSVITVSANGAVVGSANDGTITLAYSTDANGNTWMIDPAGAGLTQLGHHGDFVAPAEVVAASSSESTLAPVTGTEASNAPLSVGAAYSGTSIMPSTTSGGTLAGQTHEALTIHEFKILIYVADTIPNYATVVNNLTATTNLAYVNSGVNLKMHVAKVIPVTDALLKGTEVSELSSLTTASGPFATLAADMEATSPDFVQFIHPLVPTQAACGIANLNGGAGTAFSKNNIFSVVSYGISGEYYCNNWTQAHEIGHNMGMAHDKADSIGIVGHFHDSYGYGLANTYGDIMSYYPSTGIFSTPNLYWRPAGDNALNDKRFPMGVLNRADTVRGLNLVAPQVELFHILTQ